MASRSVPSWTGAAGSAWPSLTVSGGGTVAWNSAENLGSIAPVTSDVIIARSPVLDGSGSGGVSVTRNSTIYVASLTQVGRSTDASSYLSATTSMTMQDTGGTGTSAYDCALLMVSTAASAGNHYHEIDITNSTNGWKNTGVTYTKVADTTFAGPVSGVTYTTRMTAWIVAGFSGAAGTIRVQTSSTSGQGSYSWTGSAYTAVGTAVTTQNAQIMVYGLKGVASGSNYSAAIRTANTAYVSAASGAGLGTTNFTLANNLSTANNIVVACIGKVGLAATPNRMSYDNSTTATPYGMLNSSTTAWDPATAANNTISTSSPNGTMAFLFQAPPPFIDSGKAPADATARKLSTNWKPVIQWANTAQAWGGFVLELVENPGTAASTTYSAPYDTTLVRTAPGAMEATEVRLVSPGGPGSYANIPFIQHYYYGFLNTTSTDTVIDAFAAMPLARRCSFTNNGTTYEYAISASMREYSKGGDRTVQAKLLWIQDDTQAVIGTATIVATAANCPSSMTSLVRTALRVENSSNGGLWIAFKAWTYGGTEPAWPPFETAQTTFTTSSIVYSVVDTQLRSTIINGIGSGTAGVLLRQYASNNQFWYATADPQVRTADTGLISYEDRPIYSHAATASGSSGGTGTGRLIAVASASCSGSSGQTIAGTAIRLATASCSGSSDQTIAGTGIRLASASCSGSSDQTVAGTAIRLATATLHGQTGGEDSASVRLTRYATATLAGQAASEDAVAATRIRLAAAPLDGTTTLHADSLHTHLLVGTATASSSMTVTALVAPLGGAWFDATSSGTGTGALTAHATASVTATGTSSAASLAVQHVAAAASATGTIVADSVHINVAAANLAASSSHAVESLHVNCAAATGTTSTSMTVAGTTVRIAGSTLTGTSGSSVGVSLGVHALAAASAASTLTVDGFRFRQGIAVLTGVGTLAVSGKRVHPLADTLRVTTTRKLGGTAVATSKVGTGIMSTVRARE